MSRRIANENDRRTRYTKKMIKDAYLELLDELPPAKITVTELCRRADINRGTFYLHYEDLPRVMEELENVVYEEIITFINKSLADERNRQTLSDDFFIHWLQDKKMQNVLFKSTNSERLNEKVVAYAESLLTELCIETGQLNEIEAGLFSSFMVYACLKAGKKLNESPENELVERSAFVNRLVKALFAAAVDPYEINTAYSKKTHQP